MLRGVPFGHGGSRYILSRGTMESFVGGHEGIANRYDVRAEGVCCGDFLLSKALRETSRIEVQGAVGFPRSAWVVAASS